MRKYKTIGITITDVTIDKYEIDIAIIENFLWITINNNVMNSAGMSKLDIDWEIKIF